MKEFLANLRSIIQEKGFKHKFVAQKMGIDERKLSAILNGRKVVDVEIILSLCKVLEVSPNELLGKEESV